MNPVKGLISLIATVAIAAVVAYAVSAPRTVDHAMNQEMDALGGKAINEHVALAQAKADKERCEAYSRRAKEAWDNAADRGTVDRDSDQIDELDRQADKFCKR